MNSIWDTEKKEEDDFYWLLGCDELSSTEQIITEYKVRVLDVHPDKNPDDPLAVEKFQKLQRARDVLADEKLRNGYDKWRRSGLTIPYEMWHSMRGSIHTSMHWASKKKKEPMLEDRSQLQPQTSGHSTDSTDSTNQNFSMPVNWSREKGDDVLRKFRNYQI